MHRELGFHVVVVAQCYRRTFMNMHALKQEIGRIYRCKHTFMDCRWRYSCLCCNGCDKCAYCFCVRIVNSVVIVVYLRLALAY